MERVRLIREQHIPYASPDGVQLYLDIVRPVQAQALPVLMLVFGGGWCSGDRTTLAAPAQRLARAGYVVANVEYRLAPAHPYPTALDDLRTAIAWLHAHACEYGGDASYLGAYGVSAGGHLVALLATLQDSQLACAVSWGGPMDLRQAPVTHRYRSYPLAFMGTCPHEVPDLYAEASPVCRLTVTSAPLLLIHGEEDDVVPIAQCQAMAGAAEACGARVETVVLPGVGHIPGDPREPVNAAAWERMRHFFYQHLSVESALRGEKNG